MSESPSDQPVVLLVEDDGLLLMEASDTLADAGFTVLEASHADKALKVLENRDDVGVLMTDVDMPQGSMDGFALARLVAHRWPGIPVLFVTGFADTTALTQAGAVGADAIVLKPFRDGELERKVASALAVRPQASLRLVSNRVTSS